MQVFESVEYCRTFDHDDSNRYDRNSMTQERAILRVSLGEVRKRSVAHYIEPNDITPRSQIVESRSLWMTYKQRFTRGRRHHNSQTAVKLQGKGGVLCNLVRVCRTTITFDHC